MKLNFVDYHGPTGAYVATDRGVLPLSSAEGMAAAIDSAMLVSLGHTEKAAEYQRLIERRKPISAAQRSDLRSGLPGTPDDQRRDFRAAMKKHAETLRRLAR